MVLDRIATARDDTFAARIAMILMTIGVTASGEVDTTPNHANRLAFADKLFKGLVNNKVVAAVVIASNATIQSTIDTSPLLLGSNVPDGDIEFVLTGLYDTLANAYAAA